MGKMNVAQFAGELGLAGRAAAGAAAIGWSIQAERYRHHIGTGQVAAAGTPARCAWCAGKNKITLVRRETTAIKKADSTGKSRTIQVEVRKKRTVAPAAAQAAEAPSAAAAQVPKRPSREQAVAKKGLDEQELKAREEEARLQAELAARQAAEIQAKTRAQQTQSGCRRTGTSACAPNPWSK